MIFAIRLAATFFALSTIASVAAPPPAAPIPLTRPGLHRTLKTLKLLDAQRRLVGFHHVCDLLVSNRRLPVIYVMEVVPADPGQPERGVHTTFILNSRLTAATPIEGQTSAPLSCSANALIYREPVQGLSVPGQGNAIEFTGETKAGSVTAAPSALVERSPYPSVATPNAPVQ